MNLLGNIAGSTVGSAMDYHYAKKSQQKQMDFQERMSNTSYQRSRADMEKAGLNPILMASSSGASTTQGASAQSDFSGGLSTALQASMMRAQIDKIRAESANVKLDSAYKQYWNNAFSIPNMLFEPVKNLVGSGLRQFHERNKPKPLIYGKRR